MDEPTEREVGEAQGLLDSRDSLPSDEELAHRALHGCSASFDELARRHQVPLLHYLRRWVSQEDAEDVLQDTFVRAYRNLAKYDPTWRFATWLFTIARRLSINLQQQRQLANSALCDQIADHRPQPQQVACQQEQQRRLWDLAAQVLTEPQLTATWLHYVEDMPVKQIARVLGCSQVATKATLFRARKRLLPLLTDYT